MIEIYTDGSSDREGYGGWSFYIPDEFHHDSGYAWPTTNNQMEMYAAIRALRWAGLAPARIFSDSMYLINGINHWVWDWQKRGWRTGGGSPVANKDLWERLVNLVERQRPVEWVHVKGHSGDTNNEECDRLAGLARLEGRRQRGLIAA